MRRPTAPATATPAAHKGPITRAFLEVLEALMWGFHNSRTGCCFPSYERIAEKAECSRTTVYQALKVLEWAGVLTWQHRIVRVRERCADLGGRAGWQWRVVRTSNAYVFRDPAGQQLRGVSVTEFGNRGGTPDQELSKSLSARTGATGSPLERDLARLGSVIAVKNGLEQGGGG